MIFDKVIKNGTVVTSTSMYQAAIAVNKGKVAAVIKGDILPQANETIDARGKYVIPGLVDCHTHFRGLGVAHKEDYVTGSKSAAAGGVTFVMDMPNILPPTTTADRYLKRKKIAESESIIDFNLVGGATLDKKEIMGMAEAGAVGFKIFMYKYRALATVDEPGKRSAIISELYFSEDAQLLEAFRLIKETGRVAIVHVASESIQNWHKERLQKEGRNDLHAFMEPWIHPDSYFGVRLAAEKVIALARYTGVRLHICHAWPPTREPIKRAKEEGLPVTTCGGYVPVVYPDDLEKWGPYVLQYPRPKEEIEATFEALASGIIDCLSPDHSPHHKDEKEAGKDNIWVTPTGMPKIQPHLSLVLTELNKGRMTFPHLVKISSENPARIFGLYPMKGTIQVGSDADLVIIDLEKEAVIRLEDQYSKAGYTAYEGRKVKGVPILTMVRGEVIMREDEILKQPGYGRFVAIGEK